MDVERAKDYIDNYYRRQAENKVYKMRYMHTYEIWLFDIYGLQTYLKNFKISFCLLIGYFIYIEFSYKTNKQIKIPIKFDFSVFRSE